MSSINKHLLRQLHYFLSSGFQSPANPSRPPVSLFCHSIAASFFHFYKEKNAKNLHKDVAVRKKKETVHSYSGHGL